MNRHDFSAKCGCLRCRAKSEVALGEEVLRAMLQSHEGLTGSVADDDLGGRQSQGCRPLVGVEVRDGARSATGDGFPEDGLEVSLQPARVSVRAGEVFSLDVLATVPRGIVVERIRASLRLDDPFLELVAATPGSAIPMTASEFHETKCGFRAEGLHLDGLAYYWLATIALRASGASGQTHVRLDDLVHIGTDVGGVAATWKGCEVNVSPRRERRPVLSLRPRSGSPEAVRDRQFIVDVVATAVHNLGSARFDLDWNEGVFELLRIEDGEMLARHGGAIGRVPCSGLGAWLIRTPPPRGEGPQGVSGDGVLASFVFRPVGSSHPSRNRATAPHAGRSGIYLRRPETSLWDMQAGLDERSRMKFDVEHLEVRVRTGGKRDKPARGMREERELSVRHHEVLRLTYEQRFLTVRQMNRSFAYRPTESKSVSSATRKIDRDLRRRGLLTEAYREGCEFLRNTRTRVITKKGVALLRSLGWADDQLPYREVHAATYDHDSRLTDLRIAFRAAHAQGMLPFAWTAERVIRHRWQARNPGRKFAPDALLASETGLAIALELEMELGEPPKYVDWLRRYRELLPLERIAGVLVVVTSERARDRFLQQARTRVRQLVERDDVLRLRFDGALPLDVFRVALLSHLLKEPAFALVRWLDPRSGAKRQAELRSLAVRSAWEGTPLAPSESFEATVLRGSFVGGATPDDYLLYLAKRHHDAGRGELDALLRSRRLVAVDPGSVVRARETRQVRFGSGEPVLRRVVLTTPPHDGTSVWLLDAYVDEDPARGWVLRSRAA